MQPASAYMFPRRLHWQRRSRGFRVRRVGCAAWQQGRAAGSDAVGPWRRMRMRGLVVRLMLGCPASELGIEHEGFTIEEHEIHDPKHGDANSDDAIMNPKAGGHSSESEKNEKKIKSEWSELAASQ